jgi:hypothetical protein
MCIVLPMVDRERRLRMRRSVPTIFDEGKAIMSASRRDRLRRALPFRKKFSARRSAGLMVDEQSKLADASTPADVTSVRAKSQRHGKSTADKWNQ